MGIKYKIEEYPERENLHQSVSPRLYRSRNVFFFLFLLCTFLFMASGLFLNQQSLEKNLILAEGTIIKKVNESNRESSPPNSDTFSCRITVEFCLRNGKKVQKEIPLETEFCSHVNPGDSISILYRYQAWKGSIEVISYSRLPIRYKNEEEKN